jgi:hypothetical protein
MEGVALAFGLSDRIELARARVQLETLDVLDDVWTGYLEMADQDMVDRDRAELLALADAVQGSIPGAQSGVARLSRTLEAFSEQDVDRAIGEIEERFPEVVASLRLELADVLEEYSFRGLLIDACLFLLEQLPEEEATIRAKRDRIEQGEFVPGDVSRGAKCAMGVAFLGFGVADIVMTGGVLSIVVGGGAHAGAFVLGWQDCRNTVSTIWRRLRR